jgi:hypothetical protein
LKDPCSHAVLAGDSSGKIGAQGEIQEWKLFIWTQESWFWSRETF